MRGVEDPERMVARETFSEGGNQREKGPQPSKKGRIPGPAGEGKGAGRCEYADEDEGGGMGKGYLVNSRFRNGASGTETNVLIARYALSHYCLSRGTRV
jgi:hypothetical protein